MEGETTTEKKQMADRTWEFVTRTGLNIVVRAAGPNDNAILDDLFHHVSPEDLRFRFLAGMKEVPPEQIREMTPSTTTLSKPISGFSMTTKLLWLRPCWHAKAPVAGVRSQFRSAPTTGATELAGKCLPW
jgi:hypothetical protein